MKYFEEVKEIPKYTVRSKSRTILEEFLKSNLKLVRLNNDLITGEARVLSSTLQIVSKTNKHPIRIHYRADKNTIYLERIDD